jgi:hypothetical protein
MLHIEALHRHWGNRKALLPSYPAHVGASERGAANRPNLFTLQEQHQSPPTHSLTFATTWLLRPPSICAAGVCAPKHFFCFF